MSKLYERLISDQLSAHFNNIFHNFLAAFRASYGCQTTLLRIVEDWKAALDENKYVGAVLMDLSKAFDCLPHDLLIEKLKAYGVTQESCNLMSSYLSDRLQRVKIGNNVSSWSTIIKGVPQGSILGPLLFNIFINDIFYFVTKTTIYNYADDNTVSYSDKDLEILKETLISECLKLLRWFVDNQMQANPDKFQSISVGKKTHSALASLEIADVSIPCSENVKLLGVELDYKLDFDIQVTQICKKAARQLNVLQRLSKFLNEKSRFLIYKSFIQSNFNYCPLVWHFCSKTNTEKLEKIQFRALKVVFCDYESDYATLLNKAQMPTLHISRLRCIAAEAYKCIYNLSPDYIRDLVELKQSSYNFRYENTAKVPKVRTTAYGKKSFRFEAARVWNSLPNEMRTAENFPEFRRMVRTWTGPRCGCAICSCSGG